MGPSRADDYQGRVANLTIDMVEDDFYAEIQSVLLDEPILHVRGENVPLHPFRYRRRSGHLPADLQDFPGNVLLLSAFSQWRATREAENGGLVPSKEPGRTISEVIGTLVASEDAWGEQDSIILRDVMSVGPTLLPVSLRLHKFHAIMMAALESALDELEV